MANYLVLIYDVEAEWAKADASVAERSDSAVAVCTARGSAMARPEAPARGATGGRTRPLPVSSTGPGQAASTITGTTTGRLVLMPVATMGPGDRLHRAVPARLTTPCRAHWAARARVPSHHPLAGGHVSAPFRRPHVRPRPRSRSARRP
jgi:hypothetical protein